MSGRVWRTVFTGTPRRRRSRVIRSLALATAVFACDPAGYAALARGPEEGRPALSEASTILLDVAPPHRSPVVTPPKPAFPVGVCVGNHRATPILDRSRSVPTTDPTTCVDLTPKVGFLKVSSLPQPLKTAVLAGGGAPLHLTDSLLLYVPPASPDGKRRITLTGDPACKPDACVTDMECGKPTAEKCPLPNPTACAAKIAVSGGAPISLAQTALSVDLQGTGQLTQKSYGGVVIAATEITISGPVRTGGNNLVLVAQVLKSQNGASIDASALRGDIEKAPRAGGLLIIAADTVEAAGLGLSSNGAPGGLPRTKLPSGVRVHPDCENLGPNLENNTTCFACLGTVPVTPAKPADCNFGDRTIGVDRKMSHCLSHTAMSYPAGVATINETFNPATLPASVASGDADGRAPSGGDGGPPGGVTVLLRSNPHAINGGTGGGYGASGLEGYKVYDHWSGLGCGTPFNCIADPDQRSWSVKPGLSGATPPFNGWSYLPNEYPKSFASEPLFAQLLALVADEFVIADEARQLAEQSYRGGDLATAKTQYQRVLDELGPEAVVPCSLYHRFRSLTAEATGKLGQIAGSLDFLGRGSKWAPATPPDILHEQVQSRLEETTALALDLKVNALLSISSAALAGQIGLYMNKADGELAQLELDQNSIHAREMQAQMEAVAAHEARAEAQLTFIQSQLDSYLKAVGAQQAADIAPTLTALGTLASAAGTFFSAAKTAVTSAATVSALGSAALGAAGAAVAVGVAIKAVVDSLNKLSGPDWTCAADATCTAFVQQLSQAQSEVYASQLALEAADLAVKGQQADDKLFEARREASREVVRSLQANKYIVADFNALARAGQALCRYGHLEVDQAVGEEQAFKRAAALWDAPTPAKNAEYGGAGANYAYDFNQLINPKCKATNCTLWGDFNNFTAVRNMNQAPNPATSYFVGLDATAAQALAAILKQPVNVPVFVPVPGDPGVGTKTIVRRSEIVINLVKTAAGQFLAAGASNDAAVQDGVPVGPLILNGLDLSSSASVQVLGLEAWGDANGQPLRQDFPWHVSRPSTEHYTTQILPPGALDLDATIPAGRTLDSGLLVDTMSWDSQSTHFVLSNCCDINANPYARPESIEKGWTLWVPICAQNHPPDQSCASEAEVDALTALHLVAHLRSRASN